MHVYLHIPFCRQACYYCDFHFSVNTGMQQEMADAMALEIAMQRDFLPEKTLSTIYFGGGTPSMLEEHQLNGLLEALASHYTFSPDIEISLEANPDDLSPAKIKSLRDTGINRLSIGIQSFHDAHLATLHRVHSGKAGEAAVKTAQDAGITNISADLIYAIPSADHTLLYDDLRTLTALGIPHISAYCLTIEPATVFGKWLASRKMKPIDEDYAAAQFEIVVAQLSEAGYEQYEISNFAREEQYSRHNTAYWQRRPYLGIGPSAHSYRDTVRQFNLANNAGYIRAIREGRIPADYETLSAADQVNEYLLTGLRTRWGCRLDLLEEISGRSFLETSRSAVKEMAARGWLHVTDGKLLLTEAGKLFADRVASELFLT